MKRIITTVVLCGVLASPAYGVGLRHGVLDRLKQTGVSMLAGVVLACSTIACSTHRVVSESPKAEVATLHFDENTTVNELITAINKIDGAQINEGEITIEIDGVPLEVILSEETFNEGLVAKGSLSAAIPALLFASVGSFYSVLLGVIVKAVSERHHERVDKAFWVTIVGTVISITVGGIMYYLQVYPDGGSFSMLINRFGM